MAAVRKRGNTYQIRVSCGYDVTGKHIEKTMTWKPKEGMTQKQIDKELERQKVLFEEKCMTGQFLDGNITFAEFTERWLSDYAEKQLKAKTIRGYNNLLPRIITAIGHIRLCRLQPHHLMELYNNLGEKGIRLDIKYKAGENFKEILKAHNLTQKKLSELSGVSEYCIYQCTKGKNISKRTADRLTASIGKKNLFEAVDGDKCLSNDTIAKMHRLISSILTTAVQWQVIPSNPCQRVKPPHAEHKEPVVLDEKETAELIRCLDEEPLKYKTAVMLLLYTGMRRGELCGLNWSDIDFKTGIVNITKSIQYVPNKGIYEDTTKSKKSNRVIRIPPAMIKILQQHKTNQMKIKLALGDVWKNSGKVITDTMGGVIHPDTVSSWFKGFIKRHNLPDIHIHTLRHVSATLLIAGGADIATVSKRLGHADKSTTLNIYTHAIQSADAMASEMLENMLNPQLNYKTV